MPGSGSKAFGVCLPPPLMVEHVLQHLFECRAHTVVLVPDIKAYWFPVLQRAKLRSGAIAPCGVPKDGFAAQLAISEMGHASGRERWTSEASGHHRLGFGALGRSVFVAFFVFFIEILLFVSLFVLMLPPTLPPSTPVMIGSRSTRRYSVRALVRCVVDFECRTGNFAR